MFALRPWLPMLVAITLHVRAAGAVELSYTLTPRPAGLKQASFELYIPDTVARNTPIRAVLGTTVYDGGDPPYTNAAWRAFAARHGCAMIRYSLRNQQPTLFLSKDREGAEALLAGLEHFAAATGRPELAHAGLVLTGVSQGGWQAVALANWIPDRTIAVIATHEATGLRAPEENQKSGGWKVPQLHLVGGRDGLVGDSPLAFTLGARAHGALWAAGFQPDTEHAQFGPHDFPLQWLTAILKARTPVVIPVGQPYALTSIDAASGWLARLELRRDGTRLRLAAAEIFPYAAFPGDRTQGHWLPNGEVAAGWLRYAGGELAMIDGGALSARDAGVPSAHDAGARDASNVTSDAVAVSLADARLTTTDGVSPPPTSADARGPEPAHDVRSSSVGDATTAPGAPEPAASGGSGCSFAGPRPERGTFAGLFGLAWCVSRLLGRRGDVVGGQRLSPGWPDSGW